MTNNALSLVSPSQLAPLSTNAIRRVDQLYAALESPGFKRYEFPGPEKAPTPEERSALAGRARDIRVALDPASEETCILETHGLYRGLQSRTEDEADKTASMRLFVKDLEGVPAFALEEACARFRRGVVGDGIFVPRVGELRKEINRIVRPYQDEYSKIMTILSAKVARPVSKEKAAENVAEWEKTLKPILMGAQAPLRRRAIGPGPEQKPTPAAGAALEGSALMNRAADRKGTESAPEAAQ